MADKSLDKSAKNYLKFVAGNRSYLGALQRPCKTPAAGLRCQIKKMSRLGDFHQTPGGARLDAILGHASGIRLTYENLIA